MLDLPDPDRSQLAKAPLDLVVCQVRFDARKRISAPASGFAFQDALQRATGKGWKIEPIEGPPPLNITVTSDGEQQVTQGELLRGWRLIAPSSAYFVVLMPDSVAVETRHYTRWSEFRELVKSAIDCAVTVASPEIELRVGLRYVDRLADSEIVRPAEWTARLQGPLQGLIGHEQLGARVLSQQQQMTIQLDDGAECRFAHGTLPADQGLHYILDYDLYRQEARPFEEAKVLDTIDTFNTEALKLFQASLTAETIEALR